MPKHQPKWRKKSAEHIFHGRDRAQRFRRHIKTINNFSYSLNTNRIKSTKMAEMKKNTHTHIKTPHFYIYTIQSLVHFYVCFIFFWFCQQSIIMAHDFGFLFLLTCFFCSYSLCSRFICLLRLIEF